MIKAMRFLVIISIAFILIPRLSFAGVAGCGCYCGKVLPPPCSDDACKRACGWRQPSSAPSSGPSYDYEAEHQWQEAERQRKLEAERQSQRELEEQRQREEEEARRRQETFERNKQEALKSMKGITEGELGLKGNDAGGLGLKDISDTNTGSLGLNQIETAVDIGTSSSPLVHNEQNEFDNMNAAWLRKQQELIRQAVNQDKEWRNEVLASIKAIQVPSPIFRPKTLSDLRPGDILLIAPDDSLIAQGIARVDPLYRALDYFSGGDLTAPDLKKGSVSHAMTFVKTVNGEMLFLDHTGEGSRILNKEEYIRKYGNRGMYIARPQLKADGRELWEVARKAALQKKSDYGLFGNNTVCSEQAAIAVAKATGLPLDKEHHRLGTILGPVDITPNDFFDDKHTGKYFLISASPIFPSKE